MPLPRGVVRVYKSVQGRRLGSAAVRRRRPDRPHARTPRDERVSLQIGQAFGVVVEAQQGSVVEPVGGDWTLVSASATHAVLDAFTFRFRPTIPAHGEVSLRYRVRWC